MTPSTSALWLVQGAESGHIPDVGRVVVSGVVDGVSQTWSRSALWLVQGAESGHIPDVGRAVVR